MKPKTKKKRALPLSLDFVTTLTVAECCDVLEFETGQFTGWGQQTAEFGDEGEFWVERAGRFSLLYNVSPLRFAGTLTKVAAGTRVKGEITSDTLAFYRWALRRRFIVWGILMIMWLAVLVPFSAAIHDRYGQSLTWGTLFAVSGYFAPILVLVLFHGLGLAPAYQLVIWLKKYLDYPPERYPPAAISGDEHEAQTASEAETRAAAESGLRDRAHGS